MLLLFLHGIFSSAKSGGFIVAQSCGETFSAGGFGKTAEAEVFPQKEKVSGPVRCHVFRDIGVQRCFSL